MRHFLQLFPERSSKCKDIVVCSKSYKDLAKSMIFRAFLRNEVLFTTFSWKVDRNAKTWQFPREVAKFWPNRWFFLLFHELFTFFNLLLKSSSKDHNMVVCSKKLHSFGQIDKFSCFFTKWCSFCNCLPKSSSKRKNMVLCSKSCKFWPNPWFFVVFHEMNHILQRFP